MLKSGEMSVIKESVCTAYVTPPQKIVKDNPYKGTYDAPGSDLFYLSPGETEAATSRGLCVKEGRTYITHACDASTKDTKYSISYASSPDFRSYYCFK